MCVELYIQGGPAKTYSCSIYKLLDVSPCEMRLYKVKVQQEPAWKLTITEYSFYTIAFQLSISWELGITTFLVEIIWKMS